MINKRKRLLIDVPLKPSDLWQDLISSIKKEQLIPIISNSFFNHLVFDIDGDNRLGVSPPEAGQMYEDELDIDEAVAASWARSIQYPLAEEPLLLPRVAQYNLHISNYIPIRAKENYFEFLKLFLIELAKKDQEAVGKFDNVMAQFNESGLAELTNALGYPKVKTERDNPILRLAELPLKIYITTCHHNFLELALSKVKKQPQTGYCTWYDDHFEPSFTYRPPTIDEPLVYHLYGQESKPESVVITEDDYMDFLVKVSENKDVIPVQLRGAMAESSLLLLGYRLRDWEFKVLMRGIIKPSSLRGSKLAIQFDQRAQTPERQSEVREYLQGYFKERAKFAVEWKNTANFIFELSDRWEESQR